MALSSITIKSIGTKLACLSLIVGLLGASTMVSVSKNTMPKLVDRWFAALKAVDAEKFEQLLADDATIELKFLGVTQTKAEFIDALDEWHNANKGAVITTKLVSNNGDLSIVETCYRFAANQVYGRETFTIKADKIVNSTQEEISKTCSDF